MKYIALYGCCRGRFIWGNFGRNHQAVNLDFKILVLSLFLYDAKLR